MSRHAPVLTALLFSIGLAACGNGDETPASEDVAASAPPIEETAIPSLFANGIVSGDGVLEGEYAPKHDGGWMSSESMLIELNLTRSQGNIVVSFTPYFPTNGEIGSRSVSFQFNDDEPVVADIAFADMESRYQTKQVEIPFSVDTSETTGLLRISGEQLGSPADFGEGDDIRNHVAYIREIDIVSGTVAPE